MPLIQYEYNKVAPANAVNARTTHESFERSVFVDGTYDHTFGHYNGKSIGPTAITTWETHNGLCLEEFERNGYHDSDFYMRVWNEEKQIVEAVLFASTRFGCGPSFGARADATDEVRAKAADYYARKRAEVRAEQRRKQAAEIRAMRAEVRKIAEANGVSYVKLQKLRKVYTAQDGFHRLLSLFGSRIRNNFKLKLRAQVIAWLHDDAPRYSAPLSAKQMMYV